MSVRCALKKHYKGIKDRHLPQRHQYTKLCKVLLHYLFYNGDTSSDKESKQLELEALEYHASNGND
jgi:hypothetical protein